jgi:methylmalonyl-CoA/ethylmalonyl-CoA epimerase
MKPLSSMKTSVRRVRWAFSKFLAFGGSLRDTICCSAKRRGDGMRLHHAGYAVESIEAFLRNFVNPVLRPVSTSQAIEDPLQCVRIAFATLPGGGMLELIEPLNDASPVSRLLKERQGGLYHLCFASDDFEADVKRLRENGCLVLGKPVPALVFGGRRIVFAVTATRDLIELVEEGA